MVGPYRLVPCALPESQESGFSFLLRKFRGWIWPTDYTDYTDYFQVMLIDQGGVCCKDGDVVEVLF
jgi:hypothetical protein